ncbi:hypothetical protein ACFQX7_14965 [Luedemannella flava]
MAALQAGMMRGRRAAETLDAESAPTDDAEQSDGGDTQADAAQIGSGSSAEPTVTDTTGTTPERGN